MYNYTEPEKLKNYIETWMIEGQAEDSPSRFVDENYRRGYVDACALICELIDARLIK